MSRVWLMIATSVMTVVFAMQVDSAAAAAAVGTVEVPIEDTHQVKDADIWTTVKADAEENPAVAGLGHDDDSDIICVTDEDKLKDEVDKKMGDSYGFSAKDMAEDVYDLAKAVSDFLANNAPDPGRDDSPDFVFYPIRLAVYFNNEHDIKAKCSEATSGPFVTGVGSHACDLLSSQAGMKELSKYMKAVLDVKSDDDWDNAKKYVSGLGSTASSDFKSKVGPGVYTPPNKKGITSIPSFGALAATKDFFGSSGGGGGGFGFEIVCVGEAPTFDDYGHDDEFKDHTKTLLSGGGGGGGGFASPWHGELLRVGGGGGGGAQVSGGMVGAGAGTDGEVHSNKDAHASDFSKGLDSVKYAIQECAQGENSHIEIRGGGGGGAGAEVYQPWNFTDPKIHPEEVTPHLLSFGYGFQFVLSSASGPSDGVHGWNPNGVAKLFKSDTSSGKTFMLCDSPEFPGTWTPSEWNACPKGCLESDKAMPDSAKKVHSAFGCAPRVAASICTHAIAPNGVRYGKYSSFLVCNNVLIAGYLSSVLPKADKLLWKNMVSYVDDIEGMPPKITDEMVTAHKAGWCKPPPSGCDKYPAC